MYFSTLCHAGYTNAISSAVELTEIYSSSCVCSSNSNERKRRGNAVTVTEDLPLQFVTKVIVAVVVTSPLSNQRTRRERIEPSRRPLGLLSKTNATTIPLDAFHPSFLPNFPPSVSRFPSAKEELARPARLGFIPKAVCTLAGE